MNNSVRNLVLFVGGATLGAALGVLFAPDRGSETRKKILSKARDLSDDIMQAAKGKYQDMVDQKDRFKEKAQDFMSDHANKPEAKTHV